MKSIYHYHHIIPKHMGGTNDPSNLVKLTISEHAEAHKKLFEEYGNKFDYIAYMALSKQIGKEEVNYLKMLGPKNWTIEGKETLREIAKKRKGDKNPFYGKSHSEETRETLRENQLTNSWIKGIDPSLLPYTTHYEIIYPDGTSKHVAGLKAIADEFGVSIVNVHATIKRMAKGIMPSKSVFKNYLIRKIK
jgi:hypothetical protein